MRTIIEDARAWCRRRNPWVRLPLLVAFGYFGIRYLVDSDYSCIISPLNLGIHEFGHLVFSPLGMTWNIAGGSIAQTAAPLYGVFNFLRQEDYFAGALSFGWLSTSLFETARYVADARAKALALVSPFGEDPLHDWNYLLTKWNLLRYDMLLGGAARFLASAAMFVCLGVGLWMCWEMVKKPTKESDSEIKGTGP